MCAHMARARACAYLRASEVGRRAHVPGYACPGLHATPRLRTASPSDALHAFRRLVTGVRRRRRDQRSRQGDECFPSPRHPRRCVPVASHSRHPSLSPSHTQRARAACTRLCTPRPILCTSLCCLLYQPPDPFTESASAALFTARRIPLFTLTPPGPPPQSPPAGHCGRCVNDPSRRPPRA